MQGQEQAQDVHHFAADCHWDVASDIAGKRLRLQWVHEGQSSVWVESWIRRDSVCSGFVGVSGSWPAFRLHLRPGAPLKGGSHFGPLISIALILRPL